MPSTSPKRLNVSDLVSERVPIQRELLKAYPQMPVIDEQSTKTFEEYSHQLHDQAQYLHSQMEEQKQQFDSHYLTIKTKQLMQQNKQLQSQIGQTESNLAINANNSAVQMKEANMTIDELQKKVQQALAHQMKQAQEFNHVNRQLSLEKANKQKLEEEWTQKSNSEKQHQFQVQSQIQSLQEDLRRKEVSIQSLTNTEVKLNRELQEEKAKCNKINDKLQRTDNDKNRLNQQLNQMLKSYKDLEISHSKLVAGHEQLEQLPKETEARMQGQIQILEDHIQTLKETNTNLVQNNQTLQQQVDTVTEQFKQSMTILNASSPDKLKNNNKADQQSEGDFSRDEDNSAIEVSARGDTTNRDKTRKYMLDELKGIKSALLDKIYIFKQRLSIQNNKDQKQQTRSISVLESEKQQVMSQFEIQSDITRESLIRKEIDHLFSLSQVLNSVYLVDFPQQNQSTQDQINSLLLELLSDSDKKNLKSDHVESVVKLVQSRIEQLIKDNAKLKHNIETKYIPKIEQLSQKVDNFKQKRESESGNVSSRGEQVSDLSKQIDEYKDQILTLKKQYKADKKTLLRQYKQLELEKEELMQKAISLSQSCAQLENDLDIQIKENQNLNKQVEILLKKNSALQDVSNQTSVSKNQHHAASRTYNAQRSREKQHYEHNNHGYQHSHLGAHQQNCEAYSQSHSPLVTSFVDGPRSSEHLSKLNQKYSKLEKQQDGDTKLTRLITEYKQENEKCSKKIMQLKERLNGQKKKFKIDSYSVNKHSNGRKSPRKV